MATVQPGAPLGASYRFVTRIGSGATGEVWTVKTADERVLAAKILRPEHAEDTGLVERFVRERSVLMGLRHPRIVAVRDMVVEGQLLAIVMDYLPGGSLRDLLLERGTLPAAQALAAVSQVLDAVAAAHARGVTHRDIKPDNVLLSATPAAEPAPLPDLEVSDFGIAAVLSEKARHTTGLVGTPQYMAPELISQGAVGAAADVYSVGVMLYELLAGRTPFSGPGTDFTVAYRHVTSVPPRIDIPEQLWALVSSLLEKNPAQRPSAAEAAGRVRALMPAVADVPALEKTAAPEEFAEAERPATVVRSSRAEASGGQDGHDVDGHGGRGDGSPVDFGLQEERPDLGAAGSATVYRPMPRRPQPAAAEPEPEPAKRRTRPDWLTTRLIVLSAVGLVVIAALIAAYFLLRPAPAPAPTPQEKVSAHLQDQPLPTGLGIDREATYNPADGTVDLTITYSAQKAPLTGPFLEVIPAAQDGQDCPPVTWQGARAERNRASSTAVQADCAWSIDQVGIDPGSTAEVTAKVPAGGLDQQGLQKWLQRESEATTQAVADPQTRSTAYPVQRLQDIKVNVPTRVVSRDTLKISLVPVWPSGPDELNPLYKSPSTGKPSSMLTAVAGGESGVSFTDGCSGNLLVSKDGLVVTARSQVAACTVRARVGNFTDLQSQPFSITNRD